MWNALVSSLVNMFVHVLRIAGERPRPEGENAVESRRLMEDDLTRLQGTLYTQLLHWISTRRAHLPTESVSLTLMSSKEFLAGPLRRAAEMCGFSLEKLRSLHPACIHITITENDDVLVRLPSSYTATKIFCKLVPYIWTPSPAFNYISSTCVNSYEENLIPTLLRTKNATLLVNVLRHRDLDASQMALIVSAFSE